MSKKHPTPWKFDINDADEPIKDANGERVFATDDGFLGPDDDTIREIVDAVNERDKLKAERDRLRDIVRKSIETLEQVYKHADMTDSLREIVVETQREACAAIGEDASSAPCATAPSVVSSLPNNEKP